MNIQYLKYAVEIANCGSISKASEKLYIAQPNLSRAVKELEKELNVTIFDRTPHGIRVTTDGERLINYGKTILHNIEEVESMFKTGNADKKSAFSLSAPRAGYISVAFASFVETLSSDEFEVYYKETNALRAINNIVHAEYKLGIVRYNSCYDKYFKAMLEQKELAYELVAEFTPVLLVNKNSPLAAITPTLADLDNYIEIANADPFVPTVPMAEVRNAELSRGVSRRIFVFERASEFDILASNADAFMWTSREPQQTLDRYDLVQLDVADVDRVYKDVLIYPKDYRLTDVDRQFVTELCLAKRKHLG